MNYLAIIHYLPLEFYPPVTNFLDIFLKDSDTNTVRVYTTKNNKHRSIYTNSKCLICRYPLIKKENLFFRLLKYMQFNIGVLFSLINLKPSKILYYETFSSCPVYIYKRFFNRKVNIYVHNHEYLSPEWYKKNMCLLKYYHKKEINFLYPRAIWNSQTNEKRAELFINDNPQINTDTIKIIPNYPPATWSINNVTHKKCDNIRFVYVGTLSLEYTFIKEFCEWVKNKEGMIFDIYSFNITPATEEYLNSIQASNINFFKEGVEYDDIPKLISQYNVGLILYRAITLNFRHNATNKFFEYLACGLDVWFPKQMEGCYEYVTEGTYPKVIKLDFEDLESIALNEITSRENLIYCPTSYYAEEAFSELINHLLLVD